MNLHAPKGIDVENWFIECYRKHKGHPLKILIGLYKGNYNKFFLAVLFFFIKHAACIEKSFQRKSANCYS